MQTQLQLVEQGLAGRVVQRRVGDDPLVVLADHGGVDVDVTQQLVDGVAAHHVADVHLAFLVQPHFRAVGVTEQVVQIPQDLLVGTHQEEADVALFVLGILRHRQRALDTQAVDVVLHLTVGVTGDVHQDAAAGERALEAGERHHGEHLTYAPGIRQGLEQGEVREALVCQLLGELVGQGAVVAVDRVEQLFERQAGVLVQHLGPGALLEVQETHGELGVHIPQIRHRIVEDLQQGGIFTAQVQPAFPHVLQNGRGVFIRRVDVVHLHPFGTNQIGDQHGVVGGQGTAGLADDGRVRQVELAAHIADAPHHVVGVLGQAVVGGAVALGAGALIVHTQAAAHIDHVDGHAETTQLGIETAALADAALDVADVRYLGAQVEVQQLQAVQLAEAAQTLHQRQDLGGGEAELGHGATARFPHAGAGGGELGTHPDIGLDVEAN
ncbi:hypothetical protein D3C85_836030 [compost metagenome]